MNATAVNVATAEYTIQNLHFTSKSQKLHVDIIIIIFHTYHSEIALRTTSPRRSAFKG